MWRVLFFGFVLGLGLGSAKATETPETWIAQLGDPIYARREAATRELALRGHAVLPFLEKAILETTDPEIRHRAIQLVSNLKRSVDSSKHVTPKVLKLDFQAVPLGTALNQLKTLTGVPLALDPTQVADPMRPITVKTEELPVWDAIEQFCRAAGLKEVFRTDLNPVGSTTNPNIYKARRVYYDVSPIPDPISSVPVLLADGKAQLAGDRSSAVRVLALPPNYPGNKVIRGAGTVVLNLDITPTGNLKWDATSGVRIHKALDDLGRPVTIANPNSPASPYASNGEVIFLGQGQMMLGGWDGDYYSAANGARANPRIVPVGLKTDDRSIRSLNWLEGVVLGEMTLTNQTLAEFVDLTKSTGRTLTSDDMSFTVTDVQKPTTGRVKVKVRVEAPNPWQMQRLGRARFVGVNPPNGPNGISVLNGAILKFADESGKALPTPMMRASSSADDGTRQTFEYELEFPKLMTQGPPYSMSVIGNKTVSLAVPFRLKNVPLP